MSDKSDEIFKQEMIAWYKDTKLSLEENRKVMRHLGDLVNIYNERMDILLEQNNLIEERLDEAMDSYEYLKDI